MNSGEKLKALRLSRNLTQDDVAKAAGVSFQTIYKYEQGIITNIPLDKLQLIANLLEIDAASLLGWTRSELV